MKQKGIVVESYHPEDEGDEDAQYRQRVQEVPSVVEDVPGRIFGWFSAVVFQRDTFEGVPRGSTLKLFSMGTSRQQKKSSWRTVYLVKADTIRLNLLPAPLSLRRGCERGGRSMASRAEDLCCEVRWRRAGIPSRNSSTSRHSMPCRTRGCGRDEMECRLPK